MYIFRPYQSPCSGTHCADQCAQMPNFASRNHSGVLYCAFSECQLGSNGPGAILRSTLVATRPFGFAGELATSPINLFDTAACPAAPTIPNALRREILPILLTLNLPPTHPATTLAPQTSPPPKPDAPAARCAHPPPPPNLRPPPLPLLPHRPPHPPAPRLHQHLRPPPLLSLQPPLVLRLHRLHLRARHLPPPPRR